MDLIHAHDTEIRAKGARGFFGGVTLLAVTSAAAVSWMVAPVQVTASPAPEHSDAQVAQLKHQNEQQAKEIQDLRSLFLATVPSAVPTVQPRLVDRRPTIIETPRDDNGDGDSTRVVRQTETRTVVVQSKEPAAKPIQPVVVPTKSVDNAVNQTSKVLNKTVDGVLKDMKKATSKEAKDK